MTAPSHLRETVLKKGDVVVVTFKLNEPLLVRQSRTAVEDHSGEQTCIGYFVTEAAANQMHDSLVRAIEEGAELETYP